MTKKQRALAVIERLKEKYPDAICSLTYRKDYELLIATRLSAQCTDARVNIVTQDLFAQFPKMCIRDRDNTASLLTHREV